MTISYSDVTAVASGLLGYPADIARSAASPNPSPRLRWLG